MVHSLRRCPRGALLARASTDVATAAEVTEVPADDAAVSDDAVSEASPEERVSAWQRLKEPQ